MPRPLKSDLATVVGQIGAAKHPAVIFTARLALTPEPIHNGPAQKGFHEITDSVHLSEAEDD